MKNGKRVFKEEQNMDAESWLKEQDRKRYTPYILVLMVEVVAMVAILSLSYLTFFQNAVDDMHARGLSSLSAESEQLMSYLEKGKISVQIAAVSVDEMMRSGASSEAIQQLLVNETKRIMEDIDENTTGIYGFFGDKYLDGLNWTPPEDYDARSREWYQTAKEAGGDVVIIPPYLDAQTASMSHEIRTPINTVSGMRMIFWKDIPG